MNLRNKISTVIVSLLMTTATNGQENKPLKEYLNVAGPISFDKGYYSLAWTSHPSSTYYKQEYLEKSDNLGKFKRLVMLEVLVGKINVKEIVEAKIAELKAMKISNPIVNYEVFEKNGEVVLDFLLSENTADGKNISIIERNVYRYKSLVDKNGKQGLLLFAVSDRAYGDEADKFLSDLKTQRSTLINAVAAFIIPQITIQK